MRDRSVGRRQPREAAWSRSVRTFAGFLEEQEDLAGARPLLERALRISQKALGEEHPDTADYLDRLGHLVWMQDELNFARSLFERALAIRERTFGADHLKTASSIHNLATVLRDQG
jgi:tetratricopeptide (TPR) repeat protein